MTPEEILADVKDYGAIEEVMDTPIIYEISDSENEMTPEENLNEVVDHDSRKKMSLTM